MADELVGIRGGHTGAHDCSFDLEEMSGVEGEVVVGKDKFCELDKESSGWLGVGRPWSKKCSRAERPWVWGMLVFREETSTEAMMVSGGRGWVGIDR